MSFVSRDMQHSIRRCLVDYQPDCGPLRGIREVAHFEAFLAQVVDSVRRVEYFFVLRSREISQERADPSSTIFHPIMAAILHSRAGDLDEACWLIFLATHFGCHRRHGWRLVQDVYGGRGARRTWNWKRVSKDLDRFGIWLAANYEGLEGAFGNHRKYLSLKPGARAGTGAAISSYVSWIRQHGSHDGLFQKLAAQANGDRGLLFDSAYHAMRSVKSFGRMGRFDYLTVLGKLSLFPIEPRTPYIPGSTGPRIGAELLMTGSVSRSLAPQMLEREMTRLGTRLAGVGVRFPMQVIEDSLCNWQKSPAHYRRFLG